MRLNSGEMAQIAAIRVMKMQSNMKIADREKDKSRREGGRERPRGRECGRGEWVMAEREEAQIKRRGKIKRANLGKEAAEEIV